ncbi:coiled-coil protein [Schizophyllum fasciatum]
MAGSSEGALLPAMPDFAPSSLNSREDIKYDLQSLLDSKEKQLQQAGTLGQRVLAQQMELEERIRQIQEFEADHSEDDDIDLQVRDKYEELANTIRSWDAENAQLSSAFGSQRAVNGAKPSPSVTPHQEPERSKASGPSSAAQSRRAKNAAHRADDVEFAFEIGSGLLTEVRRLQSLLGERDKAIQDMKEEKDDLEKSVESLRTALKQQEANSDKYKEENWNLEVTLQELRAQFNDSQGSVHRLEGEHKRLNKLLASARDTSDHFKNEAERLQGLYDELKSKHETDIAQARKHAAGLVRDKSDLQQTIDALKAEQQRNARRIGRFGSPLTPGGEGDGRPNDFLTPGGGEEDFFGPGTTGGMSTNRRRMESNTLYDDAAFGEELDPDSPDPSPTRPFLSPNHPTNEIEALQQRLAHAQRQINTLKSSLQREKESKSEYRKRLVEASPRAAEELDEDDFSDEEIINAPANRSARLRGTPFRSGRGRGRGRGGRSGLTLAQRLGMAANSPASEYNDDDELDTTDAPPVPPIPINFQAADEQHDVLIEEEDEDDEPAREPSPSPSNRVSIDGMDPAFANVLKRTPSTSSIPHAGSPLRQSVLGRSTRGGTIGRKGRGGAAYMQSRPPSLVGAPEALSAELNFSGSPLKRNDSLRIAVDDGPETVDFGMQTDPEMVKEEVKPEPAPTPVGAPIPTVTTVEMGVQCEPEPVASPPVTFNSSMQTDPEPVVLRSSMGTQHEYKEPVPLRVDSSVGTQPIAVTDAEMQTVAVASPATPQRPTVALGVDQTPRRAFPIQENEDEAETVETDTDAHPGRSASQSQDDDFHSILTMTDNDFGSSDEDLESITTSRVLPRANDQSAASSRPDSSMYTTASELAGRSGTQSPAILPATYDSKSVSVEIIREHLPPPPSPPKPILKEMSIQTDEWKPPAPIAAPIPSSPGLYRVGVGANQQFQFIAPLPPSKASTPSNAPTSAAQAIAAAKPASATATVFRESAGARYSHSRASSDRRESLESAMSSFTDESRPRLSSGGSSNLLDNLAEKRRPPTMMVPPPPRAPPPPGSMPPPSFIPERRSHDIPPPRPSSPPPAELIQRATTPTFGSVLSVPGGGRGTFGRAQGSSMPPSQTAAIRQPPSTSSFRSAFNAFSSLRGERRELSSTSLVSDHSLASPRSSMSSEHYRQHVLANAPVTPSRSQGHDTSARQQLANPTDPTIIHAITQTMIGEYLYKYTRRTIGKGHGEKRHRRFFWVHPYTKTLYWSDADPGSSNVAESSAKSAYVEGVRSVLDPNPMPPGLYQYSVIISTPQREMKFTAPTKERHDIWLSALKYLLSRPNPANLSAGNATVMPQSPMSSLSDDERDRGQMLTGSPQSQRSGRSARRSDGWNTTPRGQRSRSRMSHIGGSIGKRAGTPAAEYLRYQPESPYSPTRSFVDVPAPDEDDLDFELHGESLSDEGFEGLENVRACCDGRHTVGRSGKIHHHHHHHHNGEPAAPNGQRLDAPAPERPISPSAWSFRSRAGSTNSREGGLFGWGRGDDGKLRFGSRRSKTTPIHDV